MLDSAFRASVVRVIAARASDASEIAPDAAIGSVGDTLRRGSDGAFKAETISCCFRMDDGRDVPEHIMVSVETQGSAVCLVRILRVRLTSDSIFRYIMHLSRALSGCVRRSEYSLRCHQSPLPTITRIVSNDSFDYLLLFSSKNMHRRTLHRFGRSQRIFWIQFAFLLCAADPTRFVSVLHIKVPRSAMLSSSLNICFPHPPAAE